MARRRATGALEDQVIEYVWAIGGPVSATEVHGSVCPDLAYTTVATVLSRLWEKGRVERVRSGRNYEYTAVATEAEHRATTMTTTLDAAANRAAVLSRFVDALPSEDLAVLRALIDDGH